MWLRDLMENAPLFHTVVRRGLFDGKNVQQFLIAQAQIMQEQKDDAEGAKANRDILRKEALHARREWKTARKLALSSVWRKLSNYEEDLLQRLNKGDLEQKCLEKSRAYGYGLGATTMSAQEAALFRMSCNNLDAYWRVDTS